MSYGRILKTTLIMGGASVVNILLGIVRTKVLAVLLGPSGIGLAGIYNTVTGLWTTACGMGINDSGVRQIAGAVGTGDDEALGRTVLAIRRSALISGILGCSLLLLLSGRVSHFTFGNGGHALDLALLSFSILFGAVSGGQTALIQGMRRVADLAKLNMLGGILSTLLSIPIIYLCGERGIAYFLLAVSAATVLTSWWFAKRAVTAAPAVAWRESITEVRPLLRLGVALMCGSLMIAGTQYLLRVFIVRTLGLNAAGVYQASTTLSIIYVGIILHAMFTDFYPRLSEASADNAECRSLINNQIEVGLLLAVPGILAIMTFAPLVIAAFYSSRFLAATDILRWQILGVLLQVVTWPIAFILRAKGNAKLYLLTEVFANGAHLGFAGVGITFFGLPGVGGGYFVMNLCYLVLIYLIARRSYAFSFSGASLSLFWFSSLTLGLVFSTPLFLSKVPCLAVNATVTVAASCYSLKMLVDKAGDDMAAGLLLKIKSRFTRSNPV